MLSHKVRYPGSPQRVKYTGRGSAGVGIQCYSVLAGLLSISQSLKLSPEIYINTEYSVIYSHRVLLEKVRIQLKTCFVPILLSEKPSRIKVFLKMPHRIVNCHARAGLLGERYNHKWSRNKELILRSFINDPSATPQPRFPV